MQLHLLTGEYPPEPGGVADYTALLAQALADSGDEVHVWTSSESDPSFQDTPGVTVHRVAGTWSRSNLDRLGQSLDAFPAPRRLVLQYAPNVWKHRGLNLGFCRWLKSRSGRGDDIRPMFHELWYEFDPRDKPTRWIFPVVQRLMVRNVMKASTLAYASIPAWQEWLKTSWIGLGRPSIWLPVPSNIPFVNDPDRVAEIRRRLAPDGQPILGSFGTFHGLIGDMLAETLPKLKSRPKVVFIGRGSEKFLVRVGASPDLQATGPLSPRETSLHLQACDLMLQPYPDGISSRRGSAMACLANGKAIATTDGYLSEPIWREQGGVALSPVGNRDALAAEVDRLIGDPLARQSLAELGSLLYQKTFAINRVVAILKQTLDS